MSDATTNEALLAELRAEYAPELAAELDRLLLAIGDGAPEARRSAHRIAGTSGSYGFDAIGALVRRIEQALAAGAAVDPVILAELRALRRAL